MCTGFEQQNKKTIKYKQWVNFDNNKEKLIDYNFSLNSWLKLNNNFIIWLLSLKLSTSKLAQCIYVSPTATSS